MRISDWSSDVCSSDLGARVGIILAPHGGVGRCAAREIERADLGADCAHVEHVHGALLPSVSASNARQIARGPMLGFLTFDCGADEPPTFGDRGEGKRHPLVAKDRTSVVQGKGVYVRVDLGGSRIIKKKKKRK